MSLKIFKPNIGNVSLTIISSVLYYYFTLKSISKECVLIADKVYNSYSFLFSTCGQTYSLTYSIISILISILFIPIIYILFSYVISKLRSYKI